MRKLKYLLENICEWPAKCEILERFLLHEFPIPHKSTKLFQNATKITQLVICIALHSMKIKCTRRPK